MSIESNKILWEGKPNPPFKFIPLNGGIIYIPFYDWWGLCLGFLIVFFIGCILCLNFVASLKLLLPILLISFIPNISNWFLLKGVKYYITESHIIFQFSKVHQEKLSLDFVKYLDVKESKAGCLTILFMTKEKQSFGTYSFENWEPRGFVSFESLSSKEGQKAKSLLENLLHKRQSNQNL